MSRLVLNFMARAVQVHRECGDPMHQRPLDELFLMEMGVNIFWREFKYSRSKANPEALISLQAR